MADLVDLSFLACSQPVLAHPLLQTSQNGYNKIEKEQRNEVGKGRDEETIADEQFLDPLGASSASPKIEKSITIDNSKRNGGIHHTKPIFSEDIIGPLDNTLAKPDEDAEMEWPIIGLDKQLIGFTPWLIIRQRILEKFNTADQLTLQSSFLARFEHFGGRNGGNNDSINMRQQQIQQRQRISAVVGKERKRGEIRGGGKAQKEEEMAQFYDLSQEEWCRKLVELRRQLLFKWREERRVDCIKLMAELLAQLGGNICSAQFYPSQFVHVTDLLDLFGYLVWHRLFELAQEERKRAGLGPLPSHWTINEVLGETRLKARNWFGKINQTVKLATPRLYMLAAILPCQQFMDPWPVAAQENVLELCQAAHQVQHPLISSYLRCYLCRAAMRVQPTDRAPHWKCLNDWLQTYTQQPISLLWPAMEWIIQCVSYTAVAYEDLHPLWEYCRRLDKRPVVLVPMLNSLPRLYLGEHALEACRIVTSSELVTGEELCALGRNLLEAEIPQQALKPILRSAWKCVLRLGSLKEYLVTCECWCQFVVRHFTANEIQVVLENILRKLQNDKYELYHNHLFSILNKVFTQSRELHSLFGMEIFAKFFDIFRSASVQLRVQTCNVILNALIDKHQLGEFTDISLAYQVLSVCQMLHDSVELSAPSVQITQTIRQICCALDRVELQSDPNQCLAFLVACRADLSNWDSLQRYMIRRVQAFILHIVRSVRYTSSRAAFLQGCLANSFISIPSLSDPMERIELSIQSAQIALAALAFLHVDSCIEFALDQIIELPSNSMATTGGRILRIGTYLLSTLAMIPLNVYGNSMEEEEAERQQPLCNFQRFLQKILGFQIPSSTSINNFQPSHQQQSNAQLDHLRLLIRCLQFIFVIQSQISVFVSSASIPSDSKQLQCDNQVAEIPAETLALLANALQHSQMELSKSDNANVKPTTKEVTNMAQKCMELTDLIVQALEPSLLSENASDAINAIGMEFLELIAEFGGKGVDDLQSKLHTLAKSVYKKCRKMSILSGRINRLKMAANRQ